MTIDELIERSHKMATEKGWWPDGPGKRPVAEIVNNFHAEISEAWEEWRAGRMELWWSRKGEQGQTWTSRDAERHYSQTPKSYIENGYKPEGFWVEIADLVIRLADTMGAMGWEPEPVEEAVNDLAANIARFVASLHLAVGDFYDESTDKWSHIAPSDTGPIIAICVAVAKANGVDLLKICELKMAYNATRPHRHGGKLA
jgi:hypothetical protein